MNSASSIRRRIAGASILVAAVAGCAGTPSALAGTSPALKELAPARGLDSATAKRLAELEQAAALRCSVGLPGQDVDQKACTPTDPAAAIGSGGGAPSLGGPARDGGGIIDTNIGCRGQHGPVRPGEVAQDTDFDSYTTEQLREMAEAARVANKDLLAEKERVRLLAVETLARLREEGPDPDDLEQFQIRVHRVLELEREIAENEAYIRKTEHEIGRRERPHNPFNRGGTRTPMPGETRGADPMAVACATMDKAGFKTPEELKQAETPLLQNVCADPAKDGDQGGKVDCGPAKIETGGCLIDGTPVCVDRNSTSGTVRRVPGLKLDLPDGVGGACAERKDTDCAPS